MIDAGLPGAKVEVTGDGRHFEALVISNAFEGKSWIQQHRMVMDAVKKEVASEELLAFPIEIFASLDDSSVRERTLGAPRSRLLATPRPHLRVLCAGR